MIGFIDFIVEPSFQVMGDMLDQILMQLQHKRSNDEDDDDSLLKINRATNTGSVDSLKSSGSPTDSPRMSDKGTINTLSTVKPSTHCRRDATRQLSRDGVGDV